MKNSIIIALLFLFTICFVKAQEIKDKRTIEVKGKSEIEVEPDLITLKIDIQEYWKEEFEGKKEKNYKNIIPISEIEKDLINFLENNGFSRTELIIVDASNSWRKKGKDILKNRTYKIVLNDINKVNFILDNLTLRGIENLYISELRNSQITKYKKQVKIDALRAAKEKADYLLSVLNKTTGDPIFISEIEEPKTIYNNYNTVSNSFARMPNETQEYDSNDLKINKIKLTYEVKAIFEIK